MKIPNASSQTIIIKNQILIVFSLILIGLNLRPSIAAIGPLLPQIRASLNLTFSEVSLLTALPILCMGIAMFLSFQILKYVSAFKLIVFSLILIGFSNFFRFFADAYQYNLLITAISAGCGIAMIQAVLPLIIKKNFSKNIAIYMGVYVTAIMGGAALSSALVPAIESHFKSWQFSLACWSILTAVATLNWLNIKNILCEDESKIEKNKGGNLTLYSIPRVWVLCIFFGLGTASYTCVLAWLPPYFIDLGWKSTEAGLLLALLTLSEVAAGLLFPMLSNKSQDRRIILIIIILCCIAGYLGLILTPELITYLWICLLGLGIGGLFPMSLILTMDHLPSAQAAAQLTSFVQGAGYIIAGFSPLIAGLLRDLTWSFLISWISLLLISCLLLLIVPFFNPKYYAKKMKML